jgi:hypothetical protein
VRLFSQGKIGTGEKNVPARARAAHSEGKIRINSTVASRPVSPQCWRRASLDLFTLQRNQVGRCKRFFTRAPDRDLRTKPSSLVGLGRFLRSPRS